MYSFVHLLTIITNGRTHACTHARDGQGGFSSQKTPVHTHAQESLTHVRTSTHARGPSYKLPYSYAPTAKWPSHKAENLHVRSKLRRRLVVTSQQPQQTLPSRFLPSLLMCSKRDTHTKHGRPNLQDHSETLLVCKQHTYLHTKIPTHHAAECRMHSVSRKC